MKSAFLVLGGLLILGVLASSSANAAVSGPCTATIAGADLASQDQVAVKKGQGVAYTFVAEKPVTNYNLQLRYGPFAATPDTGTGNGGNTAQGTADLDNYAWMGVGLYQVQGNILLDDGSTCTGSIAVKMQGNPLTTLVGGVAAVLVVSLTIVLVAKFVQDAKTPAPLI